MLIILLIILNQFSINDQADPYFSPRKGFLGPRTPKAFRSS